MAFSATVSLSDQHLLPCVSFPFFFLQQPTTLCVSSFISGFSKYGSSVWSGCPKSSNKSFVLDSWVTWRMEDVIMSPWFVVSLQLARSVQTESCKH